MKDSGRRHLPLVCLIAASLALATTHTTLAQPSDEPLPRDTITSTTISQSQSDAIRAFVQQNLQAANNDDDLQASRRARQNLFNVFDNQNDVSIAFRIEFARIALPEINRMLDQGDVQDAVTALHLAGKCGTLDVLNTPLSTGIADERAAVRAAAAAGLREVFLSVGNAAVRRTEAIQAIDMLAQALANETNPDTAGVITAALNRAVNSPFHGPAAEAITPALRQLIQQARQREDAIILWLPAIQHATNLQFRRLTDPAANNSADFYRNVVQANLQTLALISESTFDDEQPIPEPTVERIADLVTAANQTTLLAEASLAGARPGRPLLADAFRRAIEQDDPAIYRDSLAQLVDRVAEVAQLDPTDFR